jgi:hypothetical protein
MSAHVSRTVRAAALAGAVILSVAAGYSDQDNG